MDRRTGVFWSGSRARVGGGRAGSGVSQQKPVPAKTLFSHFRKRFKKSGCEHRLLLKIDDFTKWVGHVRLGQKRARTAREGIYRYSCHRLRSALHGLSQQRCQAETTTGKQMNHSTAR